MEIFYREVSVLLDRYGRTAFAQVWQMSLCEGITMFRGQYELPYERKVNHFSSRCPFCELFSYSVRAGC